MESKANRLPKSQVEVTVEMPWQEFAPYIQKATEELGKEVKVKGFRPGKAPQEFVEKGIGRDRILGQAAEMAIKEKYSQAVAEKGLEPIGPPQAEVLKLAEGNPFCFKVRFEVLPEINLPDYKKIASFVEKKTVSVAEEEVENTLKWLQKSRASFEDLKREAKKGDFIEIEYQSPQIENNKVFKDAFLLGKGRLVSGFEQNLEGMKAGEEKEFTIGFPKDYVKKELAGRRASFKVKMKKVQLMKLQELNDGFAKGLGQFKGLEELKRNLKQGITKEKEVAETQRQREEILEKIARATDFEMPEGLVLLEQERMLQALKDKGEVLPPKPALYKLVQKRVKNFLILRKIGKQEKIVVEDKEIEQAVNRFLTAYPQQNPQEIALDRLKEYYKGVIYNEKVFTKLENFAKST